MAKYGISCLCPLGDFQGGEVVLWELKTKVVLRPGDLLFLRDNLITHSNCPVKEGVRHSIVAFTRQDMCDWKRRLGEDHEDRDEQDQGRREWDQERQGRDQEREERDQERQERWRHEQRYKKDSRLPSSKNGQKNG